MQSNNKDKDKDIPAMPSTPPPKKKHFLIF